MIGQVGVALKAFVHLAYTATIDGQSGALLYLMSHMMNCIQQ